MKPVFLAGLILLSCSRFATAATLTVTTLNDVVDDTDGVLSLREAILIANDNTGATSYDGISSTDVADTIDFAESLAGGTIFLEDDFGQFPTITEELSIIGLGAEQLTIDAGGNSRIFQIDDGAIVEISGLTLTNGNAIVAGGAIVNFGTLTVTECVLSDNQAISLFALEVDGAGGGAIFNAGILTVTASTLSDNSVSGEGEDALGGGIFNFGTLTVTHSTLSHNSTSDDGGAILNQGTMTVTHSTFSANSAGISGGAICNRVGTLTLTNSTLSGNSAGHEGGGIFTFNDEATTTLHNTIVSGNLRGQAFVVGNETPDDLFGKNVEEGSSHNLIGDPSSAAGLSDGMDGNIVGDGNGGVINITTVLEPLADNGGPTLTHALVVFNPAINAGSNAQIPPDTFDLDGDGDTAEPIPFDQRGEGFPRVVGGTVDIGAYEAMPTPQEVIEFVLLARIGDLIADGELTEAHANGLINKLMDAIMALEKGNTRPACNKLQDFIDHVNAHINSGKLTTEQGNALIEPAMAIRADIGCDS